jgi:hypothetical protein
MNNIKVGDTVTLGWQNGLGCEHFLVLEVNNSKDVIHQLWVRGENGTEWPARIEGAKKVRAKSMMKGV